MDPLSCGWDTARFLIFSGNVFAPLIYYSHLGPLLVSALIGIVVLINDPRALVNRALFVLTAAFSVWVYFDLVLWASEKSEYIMFFWSAMLPIELLIYAICWYLIVLLARQGKGPASREWLIAGATFVPVFLFAHTSLNLLGYDLTDCDREAIEGPLWQYVYLVELLFIAWIVGIATKGYRQISEPRVRNQLLLISSGIVAFLFAFSAGNILISYFLEVDWSYEQYKLFGMPILVAFITYSAIRFKTFNLKVITSQALVVAVSVLVFSLLFLRTIENVRIIAVLTVGFVAILGYILIKNVKKEIEQRELIEKQEKELEVVNKQQENLLHFISHEVKGYLTESQAGFASIVEGDFGAVPDKVMEMSKSALASVRRGVRTVMEILDSLNLKKGTVSYKKQTFDLKETVLRMVEHLKRGAEEKHLALNVSIGDGNYTMEEIGRA